MRLGFNGDREWMEIMICKGKIKKFKLYEM